MDYEYRSLELSPGGYDGVIRSGSQRELNEWFNEGWEYVDNITQSAATGSSGTRYGSVLVILRKKLNVGFE